MIEILNEVSNAFCVFKKEFDVNRLSQRNFEVFINYLKEKFSDFEIEYDFLCGKDTLNIDGKSINKQFIDGDAVIIDVSVGVNNVWCDVARTFFVGEITDKQKEMFELVKRSIKRGEEVLRDNVLACQMYNAVNGEYEKCGKKLVHHAGHKIGQSPLMQPQFLKENEGKVFDGEFVTIESGIYENFGIRLENDYKITKDGNINLFEDLMPLEIERYILK